MALKNFYFRENWVGSEVAGMKIAIFAILTQHGPKFWLQKTKIWNSLSRIQIFSPLERQKLYYDLVCDLKTDLLK